MFSNIVSSFVSERGNYYQFLSRDYKTNESVSDVIKKIVDRMDPSKSFKVEAEKLSMFFLEFILLFFV